jgi:hypothetical protein
MLKVLLLGVSLAAAAMPAAGGASYFVDCAVGNDAASGLEPGAAWRTVAKVSSRTFAPGDSIRFRRGTSCPGMLWPKGSGRAGASITLGAWGTGSLPVIQSGPQNEAALKLLDQQYWRIENLEFSGGQPYGIFVSGTRGVVSGIEIVDVIVHDVTGKPTTKDTGLVVVGPGSENQHFDKVLIDGVTAYRTSQWAGILVGGARFGFIPEAARSTNVIVRNSTVHDVQGDGIILFEVNHGRIENSVAWHLGMQETETIGTPNGVWTWMCRDCTVEGNEVFLTDSPGVDGGAFDIDYGNDGNSVTGNYGHDTQGYCVAVFGAGWVTTNSVVRNNVCAGNGRSPRLARREGAIFLYTWNKGKLDGVRVEGNRIFWNPPIAASALINRAEFKGTGVFEGNTIRSSSGEAIESNASLTLDRNRYERDGASEQRWTYAGKSYADFQHYRAASGQDAHSEEVEVRGVEPRATDGLRTLPPVRLSDSGGQATSLDAFRGGWLLVAFVPAPDARDAAARGQVALAASVARQFAPSGLKTLVVAARPAAREAAENLKYDWNLGGTGLLFAEGAAALEACGFSRAPAVVLADPQGRIVWSHAGLTPPGDLGLAVRSFLGEPNYARMNALDPRAPDD